jgi:hypothetical protein
VRANPAPMSVADYCHEFNNGSIIVNEQYQRNVGLWTAQAKSFFIESILLEFPIPKLYLHARIDLKSRKQTKEVVDGQQRTQALVSFFNNKQRLTSNIDTDELRGLKYSQLDEIWQSRFLSYSLPIDQFPVAADEEVQEAFRRMNANNVPLNDEEQRNARFQGPFKWFIIQVADEYKGALKTLGLFSRRDLIRMADLKLYAEVVLGIEQGFITVKGKQLDDLYKRYNSTFPHEEVYGALVRSGLNAFLQRKELHQPSLLRAHMFQSVILALISLDHPDRFPALNEGARAEAAAQIAAKNVPLQPLLAALADPEAYADLQDFTEASSKKTNVDISKFTRFAYLRQAFAAQE